MNQPLQARAGQNAPFPWGPWAHSRGRVLGPVELTDAVSDQTLVEAVDEPLMLAPSFGDAQPSIGSAVGTSAGGVGGTIHLVDAQGNEMVAGAIGALAGALGTLQVVLVSFCYNSGAFLLAPGEKIVFRGSGALGGTARFYPNIGYVPKDPSELKAYRTDLTDGARHLIAEAPPGKVLVCTLLPIDGAVSGWGVLSNLNVGAVTVAHYLDGFLISSTVVGGLAFSNPDFGSTGDLVLPSGSKLEAQVIVGAPTQKVLSMVSLRAENGS